MHSIVAGVEHKKFKSTKVAAKVRKGATVTTTCVGETVDCDLQVAATLQEHLDRHNPVSSANSASNGAGRRHNQSSSSMEQAMQRCGICSLLSRLLRRAMCVGSRRGSGESYYQELAETNVS